MVQITRILSGQEYADLVDNRPEGYYSNDRRLFTPGLAWFTPWVFDPTGEWGKLPGKHQMIKSKDSPNANHLSIHYWNDWSTKRPPICVVCPNYEQWEIDRKSSNGDGWKVTGELPNISCSPSIVVQGYHGFLGINGALPGHFTADIKGRGPTGIISTF